MAQERQAVLFFLTGETAVAVAVTAVYKEASSRDSDHYNHRYFFLLLVP